MIDLKAAQALCDAATPGPWHVDHDGMGGDWVCIDSMGRNVVPSINAHDTGDSEFIAEARTLLPQALAEIAELRAALLDVCRLLERGSYGRQRAVQLRKLVTP